MKKRIKVHRKKHGGGPITQRGKSIVSTNAITHGLFSRRQELLPTESREEWEQHLTAIHAQLKPKGYLEQLATERIAQIHWSRARLRTYEHAALQFKAKARQHEAENVFDGPIPSADEIDGLSAIPTGLALEKILRVSAHYRRELSDAYKELAALQRSRGVRCSVSVVFVGGGVDETNSRVRRVESRPAPALPDPTTVAPLHVPARPTDQLRTAKADLGTGKPARHPAQSQ